MAEKSGLCLYKSGGLYHDADDGWAICHAESRIWPVRYWASDVDLDAGLPDEVTNLWISENVALHADPLSNRSVFDMLLAHPGRVQHLGFSSFLTPALVELVGTSTTLTSVSMWYVDPDGAGMLLALSRNAHIHVLKIDGFVEAEVIAPLRALDPAVVFSFVVSLQIGGHDFSAVRTCNALNNILVLFPHLHTLVIEGDGNEDHWVLVPEDLPAIDAASLDHVGVMHIESPTVLHAFYDWLRRTRVGVVHVSIDEAAYQNEDDAVPVEDVHRILVAQSVHVRELVVDGETLFSPPPLLK